MFSPALKASANSLFVPAGGEHQVSRGSCEKYGSPSRVLLAGDNESGVVMAPSNTLANGGRSSGGGSAGASASTSEAGAVVSSRDGALAVAVGGASSPSPAARGAVPSPQDKDFVEEVSAPAWRLRPACTAAKPGWTRGWVGRLCTAFSRRRPWRDCCRVDV